MGPGVVCRSAALATLLAATGACAQIVGVHDWRAASDGGPGGTGASSASGTTGGTTSVGGAGCGGAGTVVVTLGENQAAEISLVTADTWLDSSQPAYNYGASDGLHVDASPQAVSLIRFDLTSVNGTICVARLHIWVGSNAASTIVDLHAISEAWDAGDGLGASGIANWTQRTAMSAWTDPGCGAPDSCDATRAGTFSPLNPDTEYTVDLAVPLVQSWIDAPARNQGIALTTQGSGVVFVSSNSSSAASRPMLELTVLGPPP